MVTGRCPGRINRVAWALAASIAIGGTTLSFAQPNPLDGGGGGKDQPADKTAPAGSASYAGTFSGDGMTLTLQPTDGAGRSYRGTLTFNGVDVGSSGNYQVQVDYLDGTAGTTGRSTTVTVNGTAVQTFADTPTGSFQNPGSVTLSLPLKAGSNTIELSYPSAYAPDFDAVTVPTARRTRVGICSD